MQTTALVTGGNKGIGLEVTRRFLKSGYKVIVVARDFAGFEFASHCDVQQVVYDLTNIAGIPELVAGIGQIDVLVNNSGVMLSLPFDAYPQDRIDYITALNIAAPVALMREVSQQMLHRGGGRIVNNASIAGQTGHPDVWYGITKAGLINATKSFAKLLGPRGICVNAVAPSPVETDMLRVIPEERKAMFKKATVLGRFALAEEIAEVIFWLGTSAPAYVNGACIDINDAGYLR